MENIYPNKAVTEYLSKIGAFGGKSTSDRKRLASANNGKDPLRPHILKTDLFLKTYPFPLISNEYHIKWPMEIKGRKTTYNPDFWCETTKFFIEVVTSRPNICEQGPKWREALRLGFNLKVFWWEGPEITDKL